MMCCEKDSRPQRDHILAERRGDNELVDRGERKKEIPEVMSFSFNRSRSLHDPEEGLCLIYRHSLLDFCRKAFI